jgi:hypothetical protein
MWLSGPEARMVNPLECDPISWRAQYQGASFAERPFCHRLLWLMSLLKYHRAEGADFLEAPMKPGIAASF